MRNYSLLAALIAMSWIADASAQEHDHSQHQHEDHSAHEVPVDTPPATHDHAHHEQQPAGKAHDHGAPETSPHVPPDAPQLVLPPMSHHEMDTLMEMNDSKVMWATSAEEVEWLSGDEQALAWDLQAWYGGDYNKLMVETEGERGENDDDSRARVDVLWDRAWLRWWNLRAGARQDIGDVDRTWAGVGVAGLAPHFIEVEAMLYVSDEGQSSVRLEFARELLFTQKLVLEPKLELEAFAEDDIEAGYNRGLSELEFGLRLRYEVQRELAPYVGAIYTRHFGENDDSEVLFAAGLRFWF